MSGGWSKAMRLVTAAAMVALSAVSIGCGPAPGYEPGPRMPTGYVPEPATAEEIAAQQQARVQASQPSQPSGEVAVGEDEADEYSDTDPSALTEFKPALEGHGVWVDDATYGTVWVPNESEVGAEFTPYVTAGHWTYDETYSWTWVSDYEWGWAPYHYGRWVHLGPRGWGWIPGRRYAGAWVTWRVGPSGYGYVGWAPAPPDWYWYHGVAVGWTFGWTPSYVYCHHDHIYSPAVVTHVVRGPAAREHDGRTQPYVPANPGVAGPNRVIASPGVGGVGNGDRIVAAPGVAAGGRVGANPRVGPSPSEMGIKPEAVAPIPADDRGLARARALSAPRTAIAAGAAPPLGARPRVVAEPSAPRGPRVAPRALAETPRSFESVPPRQAALPELRPAPRTLTPAPGLALPPPSYRSSPSVAASTPSYGPPRSARSTPNYAPRPDHAPSYRSSPSISSAPPSFRSSPAPSFRSSSPSFGSSPSFRSSSPAPTFRSSPTPSFRSSSPSVAAPSVRSSAPSFRSSPSRSASPSVRARR